MLRATSRIAKITVGTPQVKASAIDMPSARIRLTFAASAALWMMAGPMALATPLVQEDFTFDYTAGPRTGIAGAGYVTFNAGAVPLSGDATLNATTGDVSVTITNFGGQTETSGPFFINEPEAIFSNGVLMGIDATYVPTGATDNGEFWGISAGSLTARETIVGPYSTGAATYQYFNANTLGVPKTTDDFTFNYTTGPRTGISGAGYVTFDAGAVPLSGSATLNALTGDVSVTITNFGGQTETSGPFFINEPEAEFDNGVLLGIDATYVPTGATDNSEFWSIRDASLDSRETVIGPYSGGTVMYQPFNANDLTKNLNVPEPASAGLLAVGLAGISSLRRRGTRTGV